MSGEYDPAERMTIAIHPAVAEFLRDLLRNSEDEDLLAFATALDEALAPHDERRRGLRELARRWREGSF